MRAREFEIGRGGREHGHATLGFELMLGGAGGLLGGETAIDGFPELERDAQGGAGRERFLVHVQHLADDVLQLTGVLAVTNRSATRTVLVATRLSPVPSLALICRMRSLKLGVAELLL